MFGGFFFFNSYFVGLEIKKTKQNKKNEHPNQIKPELQLVFPSSKPCDKREENPRSTPFPVSSPAPL